MGEVGAVRDEACQWALTQKRTLWDGGALQLPEHTVLLDAARDDDGGGDVQPLAREVDLLYRLCALELVDLKRVTIDTAKGEACRVSAGRGHKPEHSGQVGASGLLERLQLRRCADCGSER